MVISTDLGFRLRGAAVAAVLCGLVATHLVCSAAAQKLDVRAGAARADYSGLYVMTEALKGSRRALEDSVYKVDTVDGVHIRLVWNVIEPTHNVFDWSTLDTELDRALAAGKKISVGLLGGGYSPAWLADAGAATSTFVIGKGGNEGRGCITVDIPWPWDPVYQDAYLNVMEALADHLRSRPGAYEALTIVKLTGVSQMSEELRLPAADGGPKMRGDRLDPCQPSNATETWLAAGYRPSLVVQAWNDLAEGVANAFPDKLLAQAILDAKGFPPIGEDGETGARLTIKDDVIRDGISRFPGRFAVQWNGLKPQGKISRSVLQAGAAGAVIGWQTNHYRGKKGGAGCNPARSPDPKPCDTSEYQAMLERGIEAGGSYIEVWAPDVLRFETALAPAQARLAEAR